ncbi:hypothetical protein ABFS82_10G109800 [Erythranthe guttata]
MNKDKGKAKATGEPYKVPSYKNVVGKTPEQLRKEALKATPKENKLRDDAYAIAVSSNMTNEFVYPYLPISTIWIAPIELKYAHLAANEAAKFYLQEFADPFLYPKDYNFYYAILDSTRSVEFDSVNRTGGEWAYSKAFFKKVITPQQWNGDLYRFRELPKYRKEQNKFWFNYFDYIKAWDGAFCYENRQRKHSWFFQFRDFDQSSPLPQWFLMWFNNWGFHPITLPDKIRTIYDDFIKTNASLKTPGLMFAILYQVPWIMKWDVITSKMPLRKFGEIVHNIPYLGRRILIKWWDKFDFFAENSVFSQKGLINLEPLPPPPSPKKDITEILRELLASSSKSDLKAQLKEILQESDSDTEDTDMASLKSDSMQDSQDPYDV